MAKPHNKKPKEPDVENAPAPEVKEDAPAAASSSQSADYEKHPKFDKFKTQGEN